MSVFTEAELAYLRDVHPLARLATVGADGTPHVMPIGMYTLDETLDVIDTAGRELSGTKKWRDVARSGRAAIVVDDVLPPFSPRGIEVRGRAEVVEGPQPVIRIHPERIVAWGLDETDTMRDARDVAGHSRAAIVGGAAHDAGDAG